MCGGIADISIVDTLSPGHAYAYGSVIQWHVYTCTKAHTHVFQHVFISRIGESIIWFIVPLEGQTW